jgi:hypothetical protein
METAAPAPAIARVAGKWFEGACPSAAFPSADEHVGQKHVNSVFYGDRMQPCSHISKCFSVPSALGLCIALSLLGCSSESRTSDSSGSLDAALDASADGAPRFSFFVTSLAALQSLSGNPEGFGGDLRFGQPDGLSGADEICRQISLRSMPRNTKAWRAFLSVTQGPSGEPVHAIDRIGEGPWYDRLGRVVAMNTEDLVQTRPRGADPAIINDLPNEDGVPNQNPDGTGNVDNHHMLTGTNTGGRLYSSDWSSTCHDWTSSIGTDGRPHCGRSWPTGAGGGPGGMIRDGGTIIIRRDGAVLLDGGFRPDGGMRPPWSDGGRPGDPASWMSALDASGCAAGVNLIQTGPPNPSERTVGSGGGYGGFYCFALTP